MMSDEIRGIEAKHEHSASQLARDTRPLGERFAEFISLPATNFVVAFSGVATCFLFPAIADIIFIVCGSLFTFSYTRKYTLPFRLPKSAEVLDYNDMIPGTQMARKSGGISFFGNDRVTQEELWFNNDDLRTHVLIFGSTGSGKTEALVSIAYNALLQASGFIYIDGKGDNSLFAKIFSMVRTMGRDDDMLLINFMTGARDIIGPQSSRLSNTMNPFARGSSSMVSNLVTSLMDSGGGGDSGGDMWKGRAINFVESLMKILCYMRDKGAILMDANSIRSYFMLEKLEKIVVDRKFPGDNNIEYDISDVPKVVMEPLETYVLNLPGYNIKNRGRQAGEVLEQHGFITMQLTRTFGSLADTYGHILRTNLAEVDLKDVVLNRRILVVLLPALEKAPDELSNLGKIIIASLKAMMAAGLGDTVEGDYRDVILRKPTNSPAPYMCIMDEYGYYAVKGFAVVPAQARSLGFSAVFAGQDLPAFQKASKEEAASIGANCNIKICMKLEDPQETFEFFNKVAGEAYVTNVSGFQKSSGSLTVNYMDTGNTGVDRRSRIELLDLRDQREGQAHIFFKSTIIRAEMFYANPTPVKSMRISHFLKVETPPDNELIELSNRLKLFQQVLLQGKAQVPATINNEDITIISDSLKNAPDDMNPLERGVTSLISLLEFEVAKQQELSAPYEDAEPTNNMTAFTKIQVTDLVRQMIGAENEELFSLPLIRHGSTQEDLKHIERLSGKETADAEKAANSILTDIEKVTAYPPNILMNANKHKFMQSLNKVIEMLGGEQYYDSHMLGKAKLATVPDTDVSVNAADVPDSGELPELPQMSDEDESYFSDLEALLNDDDDEGGGEGGAAT
jgi:intracellular multiplication protein IcmO